MTTKPQEELGSKGIGSKTDQDTIDRVIIFKSLPYSILQLVDNHTYDMELYVGIKIHELGST